MPLAAHQDHPTCVEGFIWTVIYDDGSRFEEYPNPGEHHSFTEVEIDRVVSLIVAPNHWLGRTGGTYVVVCDSADLRPIMFRRNQVDMVTGEHARWHVFGTQAVGTSTKTLMFMADDGSQMVVADRDLG